MVAFKPDNPRETMAEIMRAAGLHPSFIHAHLKTGLIVGEDTPCSDEARQEWIDAVNEWHDLHPEEESDA